MPQRTNEFQQLITMVMELLVDGEVVESKEFPDPDTGELREVDIYALIAGKLPNGRQIRIAVECIAWSRKADAPWVEKMYGKHCRLQVADVVLLVADKGFYAPAEKKARAFGYHPIHPRIKPKTLSKRLGLGNDFEMSTKMATVTYGPGVLFETSAPGADWQPVDDKELLRADGSRLVTVTELRDHYFSKQVLDDPAMAESFQSQQSLSQGKTVVVETPLWEGVPVHCKFVSPDGNQAVVVPVERVTFTATVELSDRIDFTQTEHGEFDGLAFGTGTTSFEGKPARMVIAEDAGGNWKAKALFQYEVK